MGARRWVHVLAAAAAAIVFVDAPDAFAQARNRVPPVASARPAEPAPRTAVVRQAYELGYQEGVLRGERDGRRRNDFNYERDDWYRAGDRGYERAFGDRDAYRAEYRRGFAAGYRTGYTRFRVVGRQGRGSWYREPAAARGYSDGYEKGFDDGSDRDRYDPLRHSAYRKGDEGYDRDYGPKEAYQNNYRLGFREGYEDGYREGTRR